MGIRHLYQFFSMVQKLLPQFYSLFKVLNNNYSTNNTYPFQHRVDGIHTIEKLDLSLNGCGQNIEFESAHLVGGEIVGFCDNRDHIDYSLELLQNGEVAGIRVVAAPEEVEHQVDTSVNHTFQQLVLLLGLNFLFLNAFDLLVIVNQLIK